MSDDAEDEALREEAGRAFRPGRRPAWIAAGLNGLLAMLLLGIPYARGRMRANDAADRFAALAACLYGAEVATEPGLALPAGDRERFAARVERAGPEWPASCAVELRAMRPEPVIFLFPSPKQAEEDLRRAIDQTEVELTALGRARAEGGVGAVPERPLLAITQLRRALANVLDASDVPVDPAASAIVLRDDPTIVRPSRVPLQTASGGALAMRVEAGGLRAIASDSRSAAEATVREGSVDVRRVRRPSAVRGIALGPEGGHLLWITSESTCASDEQHCAGRLSGVAAIAQVDDEEPAPRWWIAAHPGGRIDRAVRFEPGGVWVLAVAEGGEGLEARRFALEVAGGGEGAGGGQPGTGAGGGQPGTGAGAPAAQAGTGTGGGEDAIVPVVASETQPIGRVADALLVPGGAIRAWRQEGALRLAGAGLPEEGIALATPGAGAPHHVALARCGAWTAAATPDGIALARGGVGLPPIAEPLRAPVIGASPADDAVRLVCHDEGADVIAIDRARRVLRWSCALEGGCGDAQVIARGASQIDAAHGDGTTLVAWTGDVTHPQIRVARVRGRVVGAPEVPGPCWDSGEGMCGPPVVVAEGGRILVAARENADLLVLELAETGFRRLEGL